MGASWTRGQVWLENQQMVPELRFGVATGDPAEAMFTTANFPGASNANLTNARAVYALLTGRVSSIRGTVRLNEDTNKYRVPRRRLPARPHEHVGLLRPGQLARAQQPDDQRRAALRAADAVRIAQQQLLDGVARRSLRRLRGRGRWRLQPLLARHAHRPDAPARQLLEGHAGLQDRSQQPGAEPRPDLAPDARAADSSASCSATKGTRSSSRRMRCRTSGSTCRPTPTPLGTNPGVALNPIRDTTQTGQNALNNDGLGLPVLFRQTARLGPGGFPSEAIYPHDRRRGPTRSTSSIRTSRRRTRRRWAGGVRRKVTRDVGMEVRYVGTRHLQGWAQYNLNEIDIINNGFAKEFRQAQANLQANIAGGQAAAAASPTPGCRAPAPLPIYLAYFTGTPTRAGGRHREVHRATLWSDTNFTNPLARLQPDPVHARRRQREHRARGRPGAPHQRPGGGSPGEPVPA